MQCSKHPHKSNPNPGGICAFCLQEKLGKLVSSSNSTSSFFPLHPPPSSNNSSPPSFRTIQPNTNTTSSSSYTSYVKNHRSRSSRISSFLTSSSSHHHYQYKKKQQPPKSTSSSSSVAVAAVPAALNLKRTKSVAPKPISDNPVNPSSITMDSPRKKSFWSFLYLSSSSTGTSASPHNTTTTTTTTAGGTSTANAAAMRRRSVSSFSSSRAHGHMGSTDDEGPAKRDAHSGTVMGEDESLSPGGSQSHASSSSFGRKVARSRSVGCGSRSFSGDFLERLSNGFGDCTLRRVESHRESHSSKSNKMVLPGQLEDDDDDCAEAHRMRIRCSGFFGSSSSSYWLSTATDGSARMSTGGVGRSHRGWGWAFASPMRAFRPPPASSASSVKSMPSSSHLKATNGMRDLPQHQASAVATVSAAALPPPVSLS
jgi:hypothetical protein